MRVENIGPRERRKRTITGVLGLLEGLAAFVSLLAIGAPRVWRLAQNVMPTVTITIPDDLSAQLEPYRETLAEFLRIGLQEVKKAQGLTLYKQGNLSLWKAARLAGVSLREMMQYAVAQGLRAHAEEETIREELA